jgi:hypothetical protein
MDGKEKVGTIGQAGEFPAPCLIFFDRLTKSEVPKAIHFLRHSGFA